MDSMRHLSTSLPRQRNEADLLSDFKAAALSVTNLYKTAVSSQTQTRAAGYQDALDELLAFLDRENIGLMDGEGWRVRQWATERLDRDGPTSREPNATGIDDEDEGGTAKEEVKDEETSSSPDPLKKPSRLLGDSSDVGENCHPSSRRVVSEPPELQSQLPTPTYPSLPQGPFTFQSTHAWPSNHNREGTTLSGMDLDATTPPPQSLSGSSAPSSNETVRILPRGARLTRQTNHNRRPDNRSPTISLNLTSATGNKRKLPYPDFFDISGFNDGTDRKDGNGAGKGPKRSRQA